jgi:hypothetical protein
MIRVFRGFMLFCFYCFNSFICASIKWNPVCHGFLSVCYGFFASFLRIFIGISRIGLPSFPEEIPGRIPSLPEEIPGCVSFSGEVILLRFPFPSYREIIIFKGSDPNLSTRESGHPSFPSLKLYQATVSSPSLKLHQATVSSGRDS